MNMAVNANYATHLKNDIVVREKLDFKLDHTIPKYWFNNDAFVTRLWDGVCATFPEGERYFISSVRQFRDRVTDPKLAHEVKDFIRQEGQHGIVHTEFNQILQDQGMPIEGLVAFQKKIFNGRLEARSPEFNLAVTAACEHITALMAECFFDHKETMEHVDYRVRSMLAWHSIEEMEHKAVAFDVMNIADISYAARAWAMIFLTANFTANSLFICNNFLKEDGFSGWERIKLARKGLPKIFGRKGMLAPMAKPWLDYFRPDFHPWQTPAVAQYQVWLDTFAETGDPIAAGEAFHQAAK
ncbi:MAG: metal-dependent hydrolase [Aquirhabdus sp.]